MVLHTKVLTYNWAPVFSGSGLRVGAGAAAGGLQWRRKVPAALPVGEVVAIQMKAKGSCVCSGVLAGEWTPVGFLT